MSRPNAKRGSALLEVVFATTIFIAGLAAVVSAIPTALRLITQLKEVSHADRVAAAAVEQIVMTWASDPTRVAETGTFVTDDAGRRTPDGRFTVTWFLTRNRPIDGHTLISVIAAWRTQEGVARQRVLRTYVIGLRP